MSLTKKARKIQSLTGKDISSEVGNETSGKFARAIADALHQEFGGTHAAVKSVVSLTNANERAVKNWFDAKNGPTGRHLVNLMRGSDKVLETVLLMAGRQELVAAKSFADARQVLVKMLKLIDDLQRDASANTNAEAGVHDIDVLLDQRLFELDADTFDAFATALDNPSPAGPALKSLMKRRPSWQK
jgi:hypothetical protein